MSGFDSSQIEGASWSTEIDPYQVLELGLACHQRGDLRAAEDSYRRALALQPHNADVWHLLGVVAAQGGDHGRAVHCFGEALQLNPNVPVFRLNLARSLYESGEFEDALEIAKLLAIDVPKMSGVFTLLGEVFQRLDDTVNSEQAYQKALMIDQNDTIALVNLGNVARAHNDRQRASNLYQRALLVDPHLAEAHINLAIIRLAEGDYATGWVHYDWRGAPLLKEPVILGVAEHSLWSGESLTGRSLRIVPEQGLMDEIMFASIIPEIISEAEHVVIGCLPKLERLFQRSFPSAKVYPVERKTVTYGPMPWPRAETVDFEVHMGSLPFHRRRDVHAFPVHNGYLVADPTRVAYWKNRLAALGDGPKLGLSWRDETQRRGEDAHSLAINQLSPFVRSVRGVHWFALQYDKQAEEERAALELLSETSVPWFDDLDQDNYDDVAALIKALDGVVSVCSALTHVAGALARPTYVLTPFMPDWCYGVGDSSMTWYPSVKLFRQVERDNWNAPLKNLSLELSGALSGSFQGEN